MNKPDILDLFTDLAIQPQLRLFHLVDDAISHQITRFLSQQDFTSNDRLLLKHCCFNTQMAIIVSYI